MKKISIAFVAALSLAAFGGCKKDKGGGGGGGGGGAADCSAVPAAIDRMMAEAKNDPRMKDMPPEAKKMAEEMAAKMAPKMKEAMLSSCNEDKWSADALKCIAAGKTQADMEKCQGMLTPEQKSKVEKKIMEAMGMGGGGGGGDMGGGGGAGGGSDTGGGGGAGGSGSAAGSDSAGGGGSAAGSGSGK
jgi:hypothetical protein